MSKIDNNGEKKLYRASEFAERAGVTVRALHHYDRLGLLSPGGRTGAGYRLYGEAEFARLQQIITLKFIGLSLDQIKEVLSRSSGGRIPDLSQTLRMQREAIERRVQHLQTALHAISRAEQTVAAGAHDWQAFKKIVEVFEMQQNNEWAMQYYSDEAKEKLAAKRAEWTPELQAKAEQDWKTLIAEVEQAMARGVSATSSEALALAARWKKLIEGFTGGDPQIAAGLKKLYADKQNWPTTFKKPYSDEVGAFMCAAMAANAERKK